MALTKTQKDRAYAMATAWSQDGTRLSAMFGAVMDSPDFYRVADSIAFLLKALDDNNGLTVEQFRREALLQANELHAVIVETVFLPVAEVMVSQDASLKEAA